MTYRDCLACEQAGTKPKRGANVHVVFDPAMTMPGPPTIAGHRLGAEFMATRVMHFGIKSEMYDYDLTREDLLVACWWAGTFAPQRRLRKYFGEWAQLAGWHLWYQCIQIPDPPSEASLETASHAERSRPARAGKALFPKGLGAVGEPQG